MVLQGTQLEQLHAALLHAFGSRSNLAMMLKFRLGRNLDDISLGENLPEIVFRLIECAERDDWTDKLIVGAHQYFPNNRELHHFYLSFSTIPQPTLAPSRHRLPQPCNFDLTQLVEDTLDLVDGKHGLIGLGIPCDIHIFLNNYCQRIKNVLDRKKTQIRPFLTLKPTNISIDEAVALITRCKRTLVANDVLCPIIFQISEPEIANHFWQRLLLEFQDAYTNRLMLILAGDSSTLFPETVIKLDPPKFRPSHVVTWVGDVIDQLDWPHTAREKWKQRILTECLYKDELHIQFVYDHLEYTIQLLQENPLCESFLAELEQRL